MNKLHITKHTGKLEGVPSINTSPWENSFCSSMSGDPTLVCHKCYARRLTKLRHRLESICTTNGDMLSVYPMDAEMPKFNERYVRLHSFGELINMAHLMNFYDIANANPDTTFALWTKRRDLVQRCSKAKPYNLILIYSVAKLDPSNRALRIPKGFDHCYAVYTTGPDCGRRCLDCLKCYQNKVPLIIEQRQH